MSGISNLGSDYGEPKINFSLENAALNVTIDTPRLHIRSVQNTEQDRNFYNVLFQDPDVMCKLGPGLIETIDSIGFYLDTWAKDWKNKIPYGRFVIIEKDTNELIGHIAIVDDNQPGQAELRFLFMKKCWNKGFATEAANAVVKEYASATIQEGYTLQGKPLEKITATARLDNPSSIKVLKKIGMQQVGKEEKYGALRYRYSIQLKDLKKD